MASPRQLERQEYFEFRRELRMWARRRELHPCPTCGTAGHIRRSYGFAYAGDPQSEALAILPCPTCDGTGALPKGKTPVALGHGERALVSYQDFRDAYEALRIGKVPE